MNCTCNDTPAVAENLPEYFSEICQCQQISIGDISRRVNIWYQMVQVCFDKRNDMFDKFNGNLSALSKQ
jgi:hypothetical protein